MSSEFKIPTNDQLYYFNHGLFACVIVTFLNKILTRFNCEADSHSLYTILSIAVRMSSMRSRVKKYNTNVEWVHNTNGKFCSSFECWILAATFGYPFGVLNSASRPIVFNKLKRKQQKEEKKHKTLKLTESKSKSFGRVFNMQSNPEQRYAITLAICIIML